MKGRPLAAVVIAIAVVVWTPAGTAQARKRPSHDRSAKAHRREPVQTITLTGVPWPELQSVEQALVIQARQLRRYWHTPLVRFGPHGWRVTYQHYADSIPGVEGRHDATPSAWVTSYGTIADDQWTFVVSHEIVEMLVDPSTTGIEACDPVADVSYTLAGVRVADFITPAWGDGTTGPWDFLATLRAPDTTSQAGYAYP